MIQIFLNTHMGQKHILDLVLFDPKAAQQPDIQPTNTTIKSI